MKVFVSSSFNDLGAARDSVMRFLQAHEASYTTNGLSLLRNEIGHLSHIRASLAAEDHIPWTNLLLLYGTNSTGMTWNGTGVTFQEPPIPDDWYRTDTWTEDAGSTGRPSNPWAPIVSSSSVGAIAVDCGTRALLSDRCTRAPLSEGPRDRFFFWWSIRPIVCKCYDCASKALERARESLLRLVSSILAVLSLALVRVIAALGRRITTNNLVLLLIAACRRFGHRDEPGHDDALRVCRYLSLPGVVPAM
jgi:hypothetical protein